MDLFKGLDIWTGSDRHVTMAIVGQLAFSTDGVTPIKVALLCEAANFRRPKDTRKRDRRKVR